MEIVKNQNKYDTFCESYRNAWILNSVELPQKYYMKQLATKKLLGNLSCFLFYRSLEISDLCWLLRECKKSQNTFNFEKSFVLLI